MALTLPETEIDLGASKGPRHLLKIQSTRICDQAVAANRLGVFGAFEEGPCVGVPYVPKQGGEVLDAFLPIIEIRSFSLNDQSASVTALSRTIRDTCEYLPWTRGQAELLPGTWYFVGLPEPFQDTASVGPVVVTPLPGQPISGEDEDIRNLTTAVDSEEVSDALASIRSRLLAGDEDLTTRLIALYRQRLSIETQGWILRAVLSSRLDSGETGKQIELAVDALGSGIESLQLETIAAAAYLSRSMKEKISNAAHRFEGGFSDRIRRALQAFRKNIA